MLTCFSLICLIVLEARIQQLQSDIVDVKHTKVQLVIAQQRGKQISSTSSQKNFSATKKGATEGRVNVKTHASRWMEKLKREKWNQPKKQTSQRTHDKPAAGKSSKGTLMLPSTSTKTITTKSKTKTKVDDSKPPAPAATSSKGKERSLQKKSKQKVSRVSESSASKLSGMAKALNISSGEVGSVLEMEAVAVNKEMAEEEELDLDTEHKQQSLTAPEKLLEDKEGNRYGDPQLRVRCYLEACVFTDDVARAQNFLLFHHRHLSRRKHLSISAYNIIMRMWAKKVCRHLLPSTF